MRIVLKQQSGPSGVETIWLSDGQQATVGRTDRSDFAVPGDFSMSGMHFVIESRKGDWHIRDLGSLNGTFLQDQRITDACLFDRATVRAGSTVFLVELEVNDQAGRDSAPVPRPHVEMQPVPRAETQPVPRAEAQPNADFEGEFTLLPDGSVPTAEQRASATDAVPPAIRRVRVVAEFERTAIQSLTLEPGQAFTVGSNDEADHVFPEISDLSPLHFRLSCQEQVCILECLPATSGTSVNGEAVTRRVLQTGDKITVGAITFHVLIERQSLVRRSGAGFDFLTGSRGSNARHSEQTEKVRMRSRKLAGSQSDVS